MIDVRRAAQRYPGGEPGNGIETAHAFSFGPHYDPGNLRFAGLIACNEERLAPGAGFAEHPHSHTEIVTWVARGELTHEDSTGHTTVVRPGDVQWLSAGDGVRHIERNAGAGPLVFVQMWLLPLEPGGTPGYDVVRGVTDDTPYPLPRAGAALHVRRPGPGERATVPDASAAYLHIVHGTVTLGAETLTPGDSARLTDARGLTLTASPDAAAEILIWEFPGLPG
ncbi:pirin family protein [Streptomyces qinzhouensis]|uniref:Pirin family protein n=1 Tax=Streptomyces qinzhouensis TaxID=2599401 RepID=A0A5B8J4A3_9ACTN|nr:pirin family protein [Streptomyces qinzhouensis]QDY76605.1 pirin family protein [Streptomyces qinzhouensis]